MLSTNSTGVLSRLIRVFLVRSIFTWAGRKASVVDDGGIDEVRQLLLFLPPLLDW